MLRTAVCAVMFCFLLSGRPHLRPGAVYANRDLVFERNIGQASSNVLFLSRTGANTILFTTNEMALRLRDGTTVKMALQGSRKLDASPSAECELPGKVNYLIGKDAARWHTGVPTFSRVRYHNIYPGVDLVYYGNRRQLEYDFVVAPGADPQSIQMRFEEVSQLRVTGDGDLVAATSGGSIKLQTPLVYQEGEGGRKLVAGRFVVTSDHTAGFHLGPYDHNKPLVIDPVLVFSTFLGGSMADVANAIAVDATGNVYVAGATQSPDFPVTSTALQTVSKIPSGSGSAFVTKLNPEGSAEIYSTYMGGSGGDAAYGLVVDSSGDAYIVGQTGSKDFPATAGALQTALPSQIRTSFVAKLNAAGNGLLYATYLGGAAQVSYLCCDVAAAVAIDSSGNAYVAGVTFAGGFPVTPGAVQTTIGSSLASNAYVAKLNPTGTALAYATFLGGSGQGQFNIGPAVFQGDVATALAVDSAGNAYVTGYAHSPDFPVTAGAFQTKNKAATTSGTVSSNPGYNVFVSKLNPTGTALIYSTYLGGSGVTINEGGYGNEIMYGDEANTIALDNFGNVYVAGSAYSADFPVTAGSYQAKLQAVQITQPTANFTQIGYNAFVTKLNSSGTGLIYSTFVGGSGTDRASAMAIDGSGSTYLAGVTTSTDFPISSGAFQPANKAAVANNAGTAFVAQLSPGGTALTYSTYLGGCGTVNSMSQALGDAAYALTLDAGGNVYVAGSTWSADFPTTQGAFQTNNGAAAATGQNAFIAKLNPRGSLTGDSPSIRPNLGVVDAASYTPVLTPGGLATIFGYSLANTSAAATNVPLTNILGGTQVKVNGITAPLLFVSPAQINFQVPWELAGQSQATITVTTATGASSAATVELGPAAPAIFTANASGSGQGAIATQEGQLAAPATPATHNSYVMIYCSGLGAVSNQPASGAAAVDASSTTVETPTVTIGGVQTSINFAGLAPGYVGLYQVNALVPPSVMPGGDVPVVIRIGGVPSKTVIMAVR